MRQKFITKCARFFIIKCDNFITKCDTYYKMRRLLQIAAVHTLLRKSKQTYYDKYFDANCNNSKSTLKGIKSLISLKAVAFGTFS